MGSGLTNALPPHRKEHVFTRAAGLAALPEAPEEATKAPEPHFAGAGSCAGASVGAGAGACDADLRDLLLDLLLPDLPDLSDLPDLPDLPDDERAGAIN